MLDEAGGGLYSVMSRRHSAWCIDKSGIVGSVLYHVVVVVFQGHYRNTIRTTSVFHYGFLHS